MSNVNWIEILGWGKEEVEDLRYIAYTYIKQGIYDVALTFFDALTVLTEPTVYDLQTMGALYLQLGNGLKALDLLDRALLTNPNHAPTKLNRVKALFMLGHKKQALAQIDELEHNENQMIASQASALALSYQ